MSLSIFSILQDLCSDFVDLGALHCLFILIGEFILNVEVSVSYLYEDSLNVLGLSSFTLMFICIFCRLVNGSLRFLYEWFCFF